MKLQRNNKYVKNIAKGISTILLATTILSGINVNVSANQENEIHEIEKDQYYFLNYRKISNVEKERRLEELDIKYPNIIHRTSYVNTLVVDDHGSYKIIPVIDIYNTMDNRMEVYDLFTEEKLFDVIESYDTYYYGITCTKDNELLGHKFDNIVNAIPYFNDKKIFEYGVSCYTATFFQKHLDEFKLKDNINYTFNVNLIYSYLYSLPFRTNDCFFTTYELADNYITTVPNEFRVTSEELGLTATYDKIENKYFDFWKENEENLEENLSDFEVIYPEEVVSGGVVQTLVFKDNLDNYKLMNVTMLVENGKVYIEDLFTGTKLFDLNMCGDLDYQMIDNFNHQYVGIDLTTKYNEIPYFEDKTIVKLDMCTEVSRFIYENIEELRNNDGINYKYPELSYFYYEYPLEFEYSDDINLTREEYAKNYLVSVPKEMQVYSKDLKLGLDNIKTK